MNQQYVNFHFAQLVKAWAKSKHNKYSDTNKQKYHSTLETLFCKLEETDFNYLDDNSCREYQQIMEFFSISLEFLDNSTLNLIPFEFIECLKLALNDWVDNTKDLIIVTSLVKGLYSYSFDRTLVSNNDLYIIIENKTGVVFDKKLIQINLPDFLARDYLSNAVLYHELGHFIDLRYNISDTLTIVLFQQYTNSSLPIELKHSIEEAFPFLNDTIEEEFKKSIFNNHCKEYFSDIFAAQYIANSSTYFLDYICRGVERTYPTPTHPSFSNREKMVSDFINNNNNDFLSYMLWATERITRKRLIHHFYKLDKEKIINLLPIPINTSEELHSLFPLGWDLLLNNFNDFIDVNNMKDVRPYDVYNIINNLIEKSISNFIIKDQWAKVI